MEIGTVIVVIILCAGALQGIIYGSILYKTQANKIANQILAVILFLLSYRLIVQSMRLFGLGYYDGWYYIMIDLSWIHGALIYFYTKAQVEQGFKIRRRNLIHFIPVVIQVCFSVFVRLQNLYWDGTRESLSWLGYWGYVAWMNNSTIYVIASSLIIYYSYKSQKAINRAVGELTVEEHKIVWIRRIIQSFKYYFSLVLIVLLADFLIFNFIYDESYFYFIRFYYYPFFIGIAALTYWIGLEGFSRRKVSLHVKKAELSPEEKEKLKEIEMLINTAMQEQKLYKNQQISLNSLSEKLELKPYLVSKCLSEIINKRFNDYINEFRVKEVQALMKDPANDKYTLLSLAMDAGFNSKSSFNRAVSKHLGISPSELKRESIS